MGQKTIAGIITAVMTLVDELAALCVMEEPAAPYLLGLGFDELLDLIEALPPDTPRMEFYRNWARSSRELWENGERQAASYQLTQMRRKLNRLTGEWS